MRTLAFVVSFLTSMLGVHCAGSQLTPQQVQAAELFQCRVRVLQPYIGEVFETAEIVREWSHGNFDLAAFLLNMGYEVPEIAKAGRDYAACLTPVAAPPPLPGDKVVGL